VKIPRVYWEYTNDRVNVQEEIVGMAGVSPDKLRASGLDPKLLAARGADTVLRMVLEHGYFHADPHPGNVLFLPDNRIGMIDFGMVGMLTHARRNQIVDLLHALTVKDEQALLQVLLDWSGESVRTKSAWPTTSRTAAKLRRPAAQGREDRRAAE
jgi:ubiquinone biosynthesis protein